MNSNEISELLCGTGSVPLSAKSRSIEAGIEPIICQLLKIAFLVWLPITIVTKKSSTYGRCRASGERCENNDQAIIAESEARAW